MRARFRSVSSTLCLLALLAAPLAAAPPAAPERERSAPDWRDPARWKQLRIGMSRAQVLRLLGEPGKVTTYYAFERWEYPDALGQRVNFDEKGRLAVWGPLAR